jgi:hypothetical protein
VDPQSPHCNTRSTYTPVCTSNFAKTFPSFTYHTWLPLSFINISPYAVKLHLVQNWPVPNTVDQIWRLFPPNSLPSTYQQYYLLEDYFGEISLEFHHIRDGGCNFHFTFVSSWHK